MLVFAIVVGNCLRVFIVEVVAPRMRADGAVCVLWCTSLPPVALSALLNELLFVVRQFVRLVTTDNLTVIHFVPDIAVRRDDIDELVGRVGRP